jgi:hypothetical protein
MDIEWLLLLDWTSGNQVDAEISIVLFLWILTYYCRTTTSNTTNLNVTLLVEL